MYTYSIADYIHTAKILRVVIWNEVFTCGVGDNFMDFLLIALFTGTVSLDIGVDLRFSKI
jgi:hypothetical protein